MESRIVTTTLREEVVNSITHGIGAVFSIAGLSVLVTLAAIKGDAWHIASCSIYGATLVLVYLASTFYHSLHVPKVKSFFKVLDHSSIYLLIAGTYTPFTLVSMRGGWGWTLFSVVWTAAIAGVIMKIRYGDRFKAPQVAVYIAMGWLVLIALEPAMASIPFGGMAWLLAGGCAYTLGIVFFAWERLPYNHAIWHIFVLVGSVAHFFAVLFYVLPRPV